MAMSRSERAIWVEKTADALEKNNVTLTPDERSAALEVDFGLNLDRHLGRPPVSREVQWLGERRAGLSRVLGRDSKTLARWSDQLVAELRDRLLTDYFDGHLVVAAAVRGGRVLGCTLARFQASDPRIQDGKTQHLDNPSQGPSPNCLIYGYPRDWRPATLTLTVSFLDEGPLPGRVWAVVADSFFSAIFGEERYALVPQLGTAVCRVERPRRDRLYGICWR